MGLILKGQLQRVAMGCILEDKEREKSKMNLKFWFEKVDRGEIVAVLEGRNTWEGKGLRYRCKTQRFSLTLLKRQLDVIIEVAIEMRLGLRAVLATSLW